MADIQVATDDDPFAGFPQPLAVPLEGHLVFLSFEVQSVVNFVPRLFDPHARHVHHHKIKQLVLQGQYPALLAILRLFEVFQDGNGDELGEDCHPRVPCGDFAEIPVPFIPIEFYVFFLVVIFADFGFVEADEVRFGGADELSDGFFVDDAADAVDVPHGEDQLVVGFAVASQQSKPGAAGKLGDYRIFVELFRPRLALALHH